MRLTEQIVVRCTEVQKKNFVEAATLRGLLISEHARRILFNPLSVTTDQIKDLAYLHQKIVVLDNVDQGWDGDRVFALKKEFYNLCKTINIDNSIAYPLAWYGISNAGKLLVDMDVEEK